MMRNNARFEKVKPILNKYICLYNETGSISFSTGEYDRIKLGNGKKNGIVAKVIGIVWMFLFIAAMLYFVHNNSFIQLSIAMPYILVFMTLVCILLILSIILTKQLGEITLCNSELKIALISKNIESAKTFSYSLNEINFRSRISRNSDAVRQYIRLWIFNVTGKTYFNIDVSDESDENKYDKYDEYVAFMFALRLIKDCKELNDITEDVCDRYIENILFGKRLKYHNIKGE